MYNVHCTLFNKHRGNMHCTFYTMYVTDLFTAAVISGVQSLVLLVSADEEEEESGAGSGGLEERAVPLGEQVDRDCSSSKDNFN